jgi:hypothetical protein
MPNLPKYPYPLPALLVQSKHYRFSVKKKDTDGMLQAISQRNAEEC